MAGVGLSKNSKMICAPLMAKSVDQVLNDMHQAKMEGADVVEIRLDQINDFDPRRHLKLIIENKPLPVAIVFNSLICQGGQYKGDEEERLQALFLAKDVGADYIDLELKLASQLSEEGKLSQLGSSKIIVSCYLSSLTILNDDSSHLVAKLQSIKADIIKFVSTTANITEVANIFNLLSHIQIPVISYSTGERSLTNQLLNFKFGGVWAYGSIKGNPVPGLPTISSLRQAYDVKNINEDTRVFGLISKPVSHSKGPLLHNPTFRHVGYNGIYVPMLVDDLKDFFHVYSNPDFAGFSVGIPYKEAVISLCDEVHPLAQAIGAVNTIIRRPDNGKLIGYNTDCEAAITAIEDALRVQGCITPPITGKMFVVVGAGGAGRALAFGAKTRGGQVVVFDIDYDRAKALAAAVSAKAHPFEDLLGFEPEEGAILANATPLGMHPNTDRIPVPEETLRKYELVFDAVYSPRKTRLLKEAEAAGAIVVSGVEMFLRQAAAQFSLFTSLKAPEEFMREIVLKNF